MNDFELSPEASDDIWQIWRYLAAEAGIAVADQVEAELFAAFEDLARSPNIGHRRADLTSRPIVFYKVFSYLVIYAPKSDPLYILGILHAKRNVAEILNKRR